MTALTPAQRSLAAMTARQWLALFDAEHAAERPLGQHAAGVASEPR